jgi:hypothetical protein
MANVKMLCHNLCLSRLRCSSVANIVVVKVDLLVYNPVVVCRLSVPL